jgi:hypothetical protein
MTHPVRRENLVNHLLQLAVGADGGRGGESRPPDSGPSPHHAPVWGEGAQVRHLAQHAGRYCRWLQGTRPRWNARSVAGHTSQIKH